MIHFPQQCDTATPLDQQRGSDTAFVQVKSRERAPLTGALKLSNALRMAKEPQPFFLVLVVGTPGTYRIYARHFWAEEIEQALKRVREAEALAIATDYTEKL